MRRAIVALAALCLIGLFATEVADTDFWWHLKTGEYIVERHTLPVPDPFSYTSQLGAPAYPGELRVRYFNLTHEWLAQALWYLIYRAGGFPALVLFKALLLAGFCAIAGLLAARRSKSFYVGLAAAAAAASVAVWFSADRPALITFFFVAVFLWILERGGPLWLLPPLSLVWANCHGGFFLGWVILGAYCADAAVARWRGRPAARDRRLWLVSVISVGISGLNPSGFRIFQILLAYRHSYLNQSLIEWTKPSLWGPPYAFDVLLYAAAAVLALSWRRVKLADWLLFAAFAAASLAAFRNIILMALLAPVLIATYFPWRRKLAGLGGAAPGGAAPGGAGDARLGRAGMPVEPGPADAALGQRVVAGAGTWTASPVEEAALAQSAPAAATRSGRARTSPAAAESAGAAQARRAAATSSDGPGSARTALAGLLVAAALVGVLVAGTWRGQFFQLRAALWKFPAGAADWMLAHNISSPLFNTYEYGGYLIWRLWPRERVFIDGRALNESVYRDYVKALGSSSAQDRREVLARYGVDTIVVNAFEYTSGVLYPMVLWLAEPAQSDWQLVFQDPQAMIFMRRPPPGVAPLHKTQIADHLESECRLHIEKDPELCLCARTLGFLFLRLGEAGRARRSLALYLANNREPDSEAENAYRRLLAPGR